MKPAQHSQILPRQSVQFKKTISITSNASNKSTDTSQQIADTFAKIHDTIDNLDSKVNVLLEKHEAEFLFAWRNHIKNIKKQLYDIKQKADEKEKVMNSNDKVVAMEKQMTLFRDESLRLYEQVEVRKNELQIYRRKLHEQQTTLQVLKSENKQLIKASKMTEVKYIIAQQQIQQLQKQLQQYRQTNFSPVKDSTFNNRMISDNFTTMLQRKTLGFDKLKKSIENQNSSYKIDSQMQKMKIKMLKQQQAQIFSMPNAKLQRMKKFALSNNKPQTSPNITNNNISFNLDSSHRQKRMSFQNTTQTQLHSFMMIEPNVYEQDLKNWFLDCIRSIKKEISSRKTGFSSTAGDVLKVQSLNEFKTIDKLRLLEMFLENEKLLVYMYQKIFPDRLKEIEAYLSSSLSSSQNQRNNNGNNSTFEKVKNNPQRSQQDLEFMYANSKTKQPQQANRGQTDNQTRIRVKSVSKASKSQPIKNRVMMRDGKLGILC